MCRSSARRTRSGCRTSRRRRWRASAPAAARRWCRRRRAPAPRRGCRTWCRRGRSRASAAARWHWQGTPSAPPDNRTCRPRSSWPTACRPGCTSPCRPTARRSDTSARCVARRWSAPGLRSRVACCRMVLCSRSVSPKLRSNCLIEAGPKTHATLSLQTSLSQYSQVLYLTLNQLRRRRNRSRDSLRARVARVLRPVHIWLAGLLRHHRDAALHRAGDLAQIAADALLLDDFIGTHAGRVDQLRDRLVRRVFAGDITAAALDAVVLVDLGEIG